MNNKVTITLDLPSIGRILIGAIFIWAALSKLANPNAFLGAVYAYELPFPKALLQLVAVVLPWFELLCGLMLLLNIWTESMLGAAALMLAVFILATGQAWARGLHISCGCFNLTALGMDRGHPLVQLLDSTGFAFVRNLILGAIVFLLVRKELESLGATAVIPTPLGQGQRKSASRPA